MVVTCIQTLNFYRNLHLLPCSFEVWKFETEKIKFELVNSVLCYWEECMTGVE